MTAVSSDVVLPAADEPVEGIVPDPSVGSPLLDNPAWKSLAGPLARLAVRVGGAARLPADVSPFAALRDPADPSSWADLHSLVGPAADVVVTGDVLDPPPGWSVVERGHGVQFVATALETGPDAEAVELGPDDVPEMLDLVARTQPGPFAPRTIELGTYLGVRRGGRLVAMAGQRLQPPGWVEVSAVCTDEAFRGQGLATRLVRAVGHKIRDAGSEVFLHTAATNAPAIRLYASIGFTLRRRTTFALVRTPG